MNDVTARQTFVDQVQLLIQSGFEMNQAWSLNADEVNYWYMTRSGDVQPGSGICPSVSWPNLSDAGFAEVIVLLHPNPPPHPAARLRRGKAGALRADELQHDRP